ncbi:MAG: carboxypeptidase-like regulatory domain-containing protein, partial [Crocinitomicaceae bacterium]|nr:carboxypeptidase-like regulatory domain-containing protein [Crocinitomicaceae bacterium]
MLFSQTLRGEVKSAETMLPVPFASVFAPELSAGTTAGADGKFIFTNFPTSQVTLKISAAGYDTKTITFTLQANETVDGEVLLILLEPAHIHLDEVVVSTPFGKLQNENVTNVESIRLNDINRIPSVTLSDAV